MLSLRKVGIPPWGKEMINLSNDEKGFTILGSCGTIEASVATKNRGDASKKLAGFSEEYGLLADFDKEADLMFDLLLINGCVITVDSAHTVYQPGYVAVEKDTIAAIGPMSDLPVLPEAGSGHRPVRPCGSARFGGRPRPRWPLPHQKPV